MKKPTILVTGKNGQLGSELLGIHMSYPDFTFVFLDRESLDLSSETAIDAAFEKYRPAFFINCAAYTAVDKAEEEQNATAAINTTAVGIIARLSARFDTTLIQLSTDYVFDGQGTRPYLPADPTDPINFYGLSKQKGEEKAITQNPKSVVIRTSWVYSSYGKNFVKTMLRLMDERPEISVVDDQIGSPTYAKDLAVAIMAIVEAKKPHYGIYHFSNDGVITWYDFAKEIRDLAGLSCKINQVPSSAFPTPAKRPAYSVLDKTSLQKDYGIKLRNWKLALRECLGYLERL
ncbi:MAG TPA: dTDP-4-dehydrorhamnose reductase [Arachidicoccus sp.]|nr:dTDP-4-dehydrorhamnose reductase [Arachidicoccus sp.]